MNELERMIAAIYRPEPSDELDERIERLFAPNNYSRPPHSRWRSALALLATAACVGTLCFYWGRQSVIATADTAHVTIHRPAIDPPPEAPSATGNVVGIPLREDQLAGLFIRSSEREGMLGKGPVTVEIFSSP